MSSCLNPKSKNIGLSVFCSIAKAAYFFLQTVRQKYDRAYWESNYSLFCKTRAEDTFQTDFYNSIYIQSNLSLFKDIHKV